MKFRKELFRESHFGDGGLLGLKLFFPGVTNTTTHAACIELREYMFSIYKMPFANEHELQWDLCVFQKTINLGYKRMPRRNPPQTLAHFAAWYDRMSTQAALPSSCKSEKMLGKRER